MATVEKKLKTLDVYLLYDGEKVTISDTADDNKATRALNEFKKYETMHYETEENGQKVTNAIPYHAVEHIEATESGGGEPEVWLVGNEYEDEDGVRGFVLNGSKAHLTELFTNPTNYSIYLNNTELPFYESDGTDRTWHDADSLASTTKMVVIYDDGKGIEAEGYFLGISTAPTSVEVSVKAK